MEEYAIKHGVKNVKAYINTLKSSRSAKKIIRELKAKEWCTQRAINDMRETKELLKSYDESTKTAEMITDNDRVKKFLFIALLIKW